MSVCVDIKKSMHVDIDIYLDIFYLTKTFLRRQIFLKAPLGRDARPREIFCDDDVLCCRVLAVTGWRCQHGVQAQDPVTIQGRSQPRHRGLQGARRPPPGRHLVQQGEALQGTPLI